MMMSDDDGCWSRYYCDLCCRCECYTHHPHRLFPFPFPPHPQVIRNCELALEIDPNNPKAFFRRSAGYEAKKQWEEALSDAKKAQELSDVEDKLVSKAIERIKKEIQKVKDKEKKMYGNMFG